ncbi:DNA-directed RNA polymerase [Trichosporon asahii var. asahii CBS 8904]|uniref:DNA-directed RNA polymerases I and III subunit RPAC2 n=1 Tax=Trichosporon asahii var. asahii (strain CBS 8904) TaxID=1220162 RepID=K1W3H6_TRIAC|nr:DNA-directed RNA polymerase [Trichosporon asahii var. asahii CBS 8904]
MSSEEQRQKEEAASRRHAKLDNAGVLHMSTQAEIPDKITILPGHEPDYSACTFCLWEEDHTLGNALRWMIMKDPDVEYCGYSAPHPSEPKIHLRVQMYEGLSAVDCLRRALSNLRDLYETIGAQYDRSLKTDKYVKEKDVDVHRVVAETLRERLGEDMDESA